MEYFGRGLKKSKYLNNNGMLFLFDLVIMNKIVDFI